MKKMPMLLMLIAVTFSSCWLTSCASSGSMGIRIKAKKARVPYQAVRTIECDDCDIHLYHARTNCYDYEKELKNLQGLQDKVSGMKEVDFADVVNEALDQTADEGNGFADGE